MGIFREMHEERGFNSGWEYRELRRMLSEAISRGYVEQVPVMKPFQFSRKQEWYRDTATGEIFCLLEPEENTRGWWDKVDMQDLVEPGQSLQ
jgi:hypothetical protein